MGAGAQACEGDRHCAVEGRRQLVAVERHENPFDHREDELEILDSDGGADLAAPTRGSERGREERGEARAERDQGVSGLRGRAQEREQPGESALACDDATYDDVERALVAAVRGDERDDLVDVLVIDGGREEVPFGEVAVQGRTAHPGLVRDLREERARPPFGEDARCGRDDRGAVAHDVASLGGHT